MGTTGVSFRIGAFEEEGVAWTSEWSLQVEWVEMILFTFILSFFGWVLFTTDTDSTQTL